MRETVAYTYNGAHDGVAVGAEREALKIERCRLKGRSALKVTVLRTAVVEAKHDWTFNRIYAGEKVTRLGERFVSSGLSQGRIHHGC